MAFYFCEPSIARRNSVGASYLVVPAQTGLNSGLGILLPQATVWHIENFSRAAWIRAEKKKGKKKEKKKRSVEAPKRN